MDLGIKNIPHKRYLFAVVALVLFIIAGFWVTSYGFIEIELKGTQVNGFTNYKLTNLSSGKSEVIASNFSSIRKLVPKGNYEVLVTREETSYLALKETRGMFSSTKVTANLRLEKSRSFVGNHPELCMYFSGELYSYDCGGEHKDLKRHVAATAKDPTYAINAPGSNLLVKGLVSIENKSYILGQPESNNGDDHNNSEGFPELHQLSSDLKPSTPRFMDDLNPGASYSIAALQPGFVIYNDNLSEINYYSSTAAASQPIKAEKPSEDTPNPVGLTIYDSSIAALYNSNTEETVDEGLEHRELEPNTRISGKSEVILYEKGTVKRYEFDAVYIGGGVCGKNLLCLTSNGVLDVFSVDGEKPRRVFGMHDVLEVNNVSGTLIIVKGEEILSFDPSNLTGAIEYSFGKYKYCGIHFTSKDYVVCIDNDNEYLSAVYVNRDEANRDSIDKKVFELRNTKGLADLSIYKNFFYITPDGGELIYKPSIRGYGYSDEIINKNSQSILEKINELGIDQNKYRIINIYKQ